MNLNQRDQKTVERALKILEEKAVYGHQFKNPEDVASYLKLKLGHLKREHFLTVFLNNQHQVISCETLFKGTINSIEVHTRVIAQRALELNANAVILSHNHPSGTLEPSPSDRHITDRIESALKLFDIRTLDHVIITANGFYSFASHGLL